VNRSAVFGPKVFGIALWTIGNVFPMGERLTTEQSSQL